MSAKVVVFMRCKSARLSWLNNCLFVHPELERARKRLFVSFVVVANLTPVLDKPCCLVDGGG